MGTIFQWLIVILYMAQLSLGLKKLEHVDFDLPFPVTRLMENNKLIDFKGLGERFLLLNETKCAEDMFMISRAIDRDEFWARRLADSIAKIEFGKLHGRRIFLGEYDECVELDFDFKSQYCLMTVTSPIAKIDNKLYGLPKSYSNEYLVGGCFPSSCPRKSINKLFADLQLAKSNTPLSKYLNVSVSEGDCSELGKKAPFTTISWVASGIFLTLVAVILACTALDCWERKNEKRRELVCAFSLLSNGEKLFSREEGTFDSITGIKAFAAFLIVLGHVHSTYKSGHMNSTLFALAFTYNRDFHDAVINLNYFNIDTFIFFSGALMVISFYNSLARTAEYDPVVAVIKGYLRFAVVLGIFFLFRLGLIEHIGDGPLYNHFSKYYSRNCAKTVWSTFLMYDNFVTLADDMCVRATWYLPFYMQIFLIAQIPLFIGLWRRKLDQILVAVFCCLGVSIEFYTFYTYDLGPTPYLNKNPDMGRRVNIYPHTRMSPWFLGMLFGHILQKCRKGQIEISKGRQVIGWILCEGAFIAFVYGMMLFDFKNYSQPTTALFTSIGRLLRCIGVGWLVIACTLGFGGPITPFLSWRPINYVGRISYEIFLIHCFIVEYTVATARSTISVDSIDIYYHAIAAFMFSATAGTLFALTITYPAQNLINICTKNLRLCPLQQRKKHSEVAEPAEMREVSKNNI